MGKKTRAKMSPVKLAEIAISRQSSGRHLRRAAAALKKHNDQRGRP